MTLPRELPPLPRAVEPELRLPWPIRVVVGLAGCAALGLVSLALFGASVWRSDISLTEPVPGPGPWEVLALWLLGTLLAAGSLASLAAAFRSPPQVIARAAVLGVVLALVSIVLVLFPWAF